MGAPVMRPRARRSSRYRELVDFIIATSGTMIALLRKCGPDDWAGFRSAGEGAGLRVGGELRVARLECRLLDLRSAGEASVRMGTRTRSGRERGASARGFIFGAAQRDCVGFVPGAGWLSRSSTTARSQYD